jgi:PhzF family phenazine biosynthesis protein
MTMLQNRTLFQVDAFTDELFKGNPAGVMILDQELTNDRMQNIAMEMNLSETAFLVPSGPGYRIRYFTPTTEVSLCGHATLASAHIIYQLGLKSPDESFEIRAAAANLSIRKEDDLIVMNFPAYAYKKIEIHKDFKRIIGFQPLEMYASQYEWIIAIAENENDIISAEPDFTSMMKNGLGHLMITSGSSSPQADFVVRCFAPNAGITEDPVTGSAHCALTPLWSEKLGKKEMNSLQVSKRTGKLKVKLEGDRVLIMGKAVTVFEARLMTS